MKVAYLGPKGSFSEKAALKVFSSEEIVPLPSIRSIVESVGQGLYEKGIIPLENFYNGIVIPSIDALIESPNVKIIDEEELKIAHCLGVLKLNNSIKKIYSHPQALEQCAKYISQKYPSASSISTESTSKAAEKVCKENILDGAAIASKDALVQNELKIVEEDILPGNTTRFAVISKKEPVKSVNSKTLISVYPKIDKVGILYNVLKFIADEEINLKQINSRPDGEGRYYIVIEMNGFCQDDNVKRACNKITEYLEDKDSLKVLGSYPNRTGR